MQTFESVFIEQLQEQNNLLHLKLRDAKLTIATIADMVLGTDVPMTLRSDVEVIKAVRKMLEQVTAQALRIDEMNKTIDRDNRGRPEVLEQLLAEKPVSREEIKELAIGLRRKFDQAEEAE